MFRGMSEFIKRRKTAERNYVDKLRVKLKTVRLKYAGIRN